VKQPTHGMLRGLLADTTYVAFPRQARDQQARADAFLISACRHVSAVSNVLVDELARSGARAALTATERDVVSGLSSALRTESGTGSRVAAHPPARRSPRADPATTSAEATRDQPRRTRSAIQAMSSDVSADDAVGCIT
jgi:hypothetical protein